MTFLSTLYLLRHPVSFWEGFRILSLDAPLSADLRVNPHISFQLQLHLFSALRAHEGLTQKPHLCPEALNTGLPGLLVRMVSSVGTSCGHLHLPPPAFP